MTARAILDIHTSERDFQTLVRRFAELHGWKVHCVWNSRHSPKGWPDLFLVRGAKAYAWELKREGARPTVAQVAWLVALTEIGIEAEVMRPSDWPLIERLLSVSTQGAEVR